MRGQKDTNSIVRLGNIYNSEYGTGFGGNVWDVNYVSPTVTTAQGGGRQPMIATKRNDKYEEMDFRIRKLTPLCCWRLMGFSDEDFISAKVGNRELAKEFIDKYEPNNHLKMMQEIEKVSQMSNTQLYKQAGNSIVVDVLYYIFKNLYEAMPYLFANLRVGSYFSGIGAFERALDKLYDCINGGDVLQENFTKPQAE